MTKIPHPAERVRLRWGWILACMALGVVLLLAASYGEEQKWDGVITGTLVNIGSALLFSFVLFFFENRFTRRVVSKVQAVTDAAERRIVAQTQDLTTKVDDIAARVAANEASRQVAATALIDSLVDNMTSAALAMALEALREEGAITPDGLTVPAYKGARDLTVSFTQDSRTYSGVNGPVTEHFGVVVTVWHGLTSLRDLFGATPPRLSWGPDVDAATFTGRLATELRLQQKHTEARRLDWTYVFQTLIHALRLASTVTGADSKLTGGLVEVITDDWAITTEGAEQISTGLLISFDTAAPVRPSMRPQFESNTPPAPAGIDGPTWELIRQRAELHRHHAK